MHVQLSSLNFKAKIPPPNPLLPKSVAPTEAGFEAALSGSSKRLTPGSGDSSKHCRRLTPAEIREAILDFLNDPSSLRSLWALEWKPCAKGERNPVVFSRYGKKSYHWEGFPFSSLDDFLEPNRVDLRELADNPALGSPFASHSVPVRPGLDSSQLPAPYYSPESAEDCTLVFESRFEQGNLQLAIERGDGEYELLLQNDINTAGHTQWFYFRVANTRRGSSARFSFLNLAKPDSLYNEGMQVLVFSEERHAREHCGWFRGGRDISYKPNSYRRGERKTHFTFSFSFEFEEADCDVVFFAYCHPYGYSDLQRDLQRYEQSPHVTRGELGRSLGGLRLEVLTITGPERAGADKEKEREREREREKKGVFVTGRVHPGETNGSWMMRGVLEFLVSEGAEARALRERFVFRVVPMVNVDGVVHGNYRCSLAGCDLNRRYKNPSKVLHPEIWAVKRAARQFARERSLALYCDLHGHSRRKNIFMYGNHNASAPEQPRLFPFILSKLLSYFSFEASRFAVQRSKESTARITMWRELKIPAIYTMEASFCGADRGPLAGAHFSPDHLQECGRKLCEALILYCNVEVPPLRRPPQLKKNASASLKALPPDPPDEEEKAAGVGRSYTCFKTKDLLKELLSNKSLWNSGARSEDGGSSAGSDDDPSGDNLEDEEIVKIIPAKAKKKFAEDRKLASEEAARRKAEDERLLKEKQDEQRRQAERLLRAKELKKNLQSRKDKKRRKVPMVDAWTQTSDREDASSKPSKQKSEASPKIAKSGSVSLLQSHASSKDLLRHKQQLTPKSAQASKQLGVSVFSPHRKQPPH